MYDWSFRFEAGAKFGNISRSVTNCDDLLFAIAPTSHKTVLSTIIANIRDVPPTTLSHTNRSGGVEELFGNYMHLAVTIILAFCGAIYSSHYSAHLTAHPNDLLTLLGPPELKSLRRHLPNDLATRFMV
jgi:hypothetical protein